MKTCKKCGKVKENSEFYGGYKTKDTLKGQCKTCCIDYQKDYNRDKRVNKKG